MLGSPTFANVTVTVPSVPTDPASPPVPILTVLAVNASDANVFVAGVEVNGVAPPTAVITQANLFPGGNPRKEGPAVLRFAMTDTPQPWQAAPAPLT